MDSTPKNQILKHMAGQDFDLANPGHQEQAPGSPELISEEPESNNSLPKMKMRAEKKDAIKRKLRERAQQIRQSQVTAAPAEDREPD